MLEVKNNMYTINLLLEEDINNQIDVDSIVDDFAVDDMVETIEGQPLPEEKKSIFEPREKKEKKSNGSIKEYFNGEE